MKIRHSTRRRDEKVEVQMTPMIDVVFQLLIFFIMTFKIVALEGDFNIKMPSAQPSERTPETPVTSLTLVLRADAEGNLASIRFGEDRGFSSLEAVRSHLISSYGPNSPGDRESVEIELDCDYHLNYVHTMDAMTKISGYLDESGRTVPLIEKVRFSPPR